jgi:catechol 2,3-dioxygenase-like lactoylglutathione lyase family enzyme
MEASSMITALDHIALAVRDLDAAMAGYRALLGREPNWIGGDGGARHAWFQLGNMALDVIAPAGEGAFGETIARHIESHGEGVWAVALTVADVTQAQTLVSRRGLRTSLPGATRSTHDNGRKRYWTTSAVDPRDSAGIQILLVDPPRSGEPWPLSEPIGDPADGVAELDHLVIHTANPDRAVANWGGRLGLDLRLDRSNEAWGARQLFFRCGPSSKTPVVEFGASLKAPISDADDRFGGLAWRTTNADAMRARLADNGLDVSEVRSGRKPGSRVFTLRSGVVGAPALIIEQEKNRER